MEARDFGFLACRFLSVLFFSWGLYETQVAITAQLTYGQTPGLFGDVVREQFGHVWVLYISAVFYYLSACYLWYRADWLSRLFVLNPASPVPNLSRRPVISVGLGLIGVYVLAREVPEALREIANVIRPDRATPMPISDAINLATPFVMSIVAIILVMKNIAWSEIFNYSFRDQTNAE